MNTAVSDTTRDSGVGPLTPYLVVRDAAQAIDFYGRAFGAAEEFRLSEPSGKVGHAELLLGGGRLMLADDDLLASPTAGETWRQVATDSLVQLEEKALIDQPVIKFALADGVLGLLDAPRQMRRELGVAQDAECGVDVAGCCFRRPSSASSIA